MTLTPEERQKIYEEEKARIEAQEQIKKEIIQKKLVEKPKEVGCFPVIVGAFFVLFSIYVIYIMFFAEHPERKIASKDFALAMPGETWIINDDNISVLKKPEIPVKALFLDSLVTVLNAGAKVSILENRGILSPFKKIQVIKFGKVYRGWIESDTVKSCKKIE